MPFVRDLFNTTAPHYDTINQVFSLGLRYRRQCLLRAGLRAGMRLIDVAIGMLAIARDKLGIALIQGSAEALPLADEIARTILQDSA